MCTQTENLLDADEHATGGDKSLNTELSQILAGSGTSESRPFQVQF